MDFFSSVEFYVIAITMAVIAVGAVLNKKPETNSYTYIYSGKIDDNNGNNEFIYFRSLDNGIVEVRHCNVALPVDVEGINLRVDITGDSVLCIEKFASKSEHNESVLRDVIFYIKCFKYIPYKVRYESEYNGKWCNISFVNNGIAEETKELKL